MHLEQKRILITGAYGLVGNIFFHHLAQQPEKYIVTGLDRTTQHSARIRQQDVCPIPIDKFIQLDLADFSALLQAVKGVNVVVHLAADPDGRSWESVRDHNIIGAYHIFEACRQAGVQRIVYASSLMVNFGYTPDEPYGAILNARPPGEIQLLTHKDPPRPSNIYAASKVWGEALAYAYSYQHGLSSLCVRLGWVVGENRPRPDHSGGDWLSFGDCTRFLQACIDAPEALRYDVLYAVSDNRYRFVDLEHARQMVGYVPQDGDFHPIDPPSI